MMLRHTLLLTSLFASMSAMAQSLPNSCEAYFPKMLNKTTITSDDVAKLVSGGYGQNGSTSKYWDAYSDRCDNDLYSSPGGAKNGNTLKFNQKVRIAKIQSGYALVYTENKPGAVKYPQISGDVKCLGWVPMDNLLLWTTCPTNEYGIYHKALIVRNLDEARDQSFGKISQHPDPANTSHTANVLSSIDFHYIMKTVKSGKGTRYLIAKYNKLEGTTDQVIEGWISDNSFSPWNQRTCLEPNWETDAVDYFVSKGEQAWLYGDANMSVKTQPWTFGRKNNEGQASTQYRMEPRSMRFPILDSEKKSGNVFRVTAFGSANGELGQQSVEMDAGKGVKEKALQEASKINIIVVMDGTRSMGEYFPAMAKAVKEATQYLEGDVRVGAVIYRDYADGEKNVIEYHKVAKANDASIQSFLTNIGRNGYGATSAPADKTAHEALYLGLKHALNSRLMGYSPDQSNLVFVIGDCGNDPKDNKVTLKELQNLAHQSKAQLFSFQVLNQDKQPWNDFNEQLTDLFVDQIKHSYGSEVKVAWRPIEHGIGVRTNAREHFYASELHRGQVGKTLSAAELNALIKESYKSFRKAYEEQLKAIENAGSALLYTEGSNDKTISIAEKFLRDKLGADYDAIKRANALLAYSGYTNLSDGTGRNYWQPVLFLSSEELLELIKRLEPLKIAAKTNTYTTADRDKYVKAITGIIQSMTEISASELDNLSTDDLTRIIAGGLNVTTDMLKGTQTEKTYKLSEIKNPQACPDEEFKKILKKMSTKIDNLSELPKSSSFKYSFVQNGVRSYWVPLSMIP